MKEQRLSQSEMAQRMGISANTLRAWMKSDHVETTDAKLRGIRLNMGSKDFEKIVVEEKDEHEQLAN